MYTMVIFRPDASFPVIKLNDYIVKPAKEYSLAVNNMFDYFTIFYWYFTLQMDLPLNPTLSMHYPDQS